MPQSAARPKKDFFISYNKADRTWAEWIAWHLEEMGGYTVAIQAWDFGAASNFVVEVDRAVRECERVLAVLSPDYLDSLFTKPEWAAYFVQDPASEQGRILPVRVRACELTGLLAAIVYIDIVGKDEPDAKRELLDGVRIGRRKPESVPSFPGLAAAAVTGRPPFPGALPQIWNVPHLRNPNFTESGQGLTRLHNAFRSGRPAARTQALTGLGGVGKTQLALEYAYRHATDYAAVWWLRAEEPATLAEDFAALAQKFGLPEKDAPELPTVIIAVREELRHRSDWLLVFDNAKTPEEIRSYLPGNVGHVLITSRDQVWGVVAQKVEVEKWSSQVAIEFLTRRTGHVDFAAAAEIARELDHLPLALEQAAAYVESSGGTLASYLTIFQKHQRELLQRGGPISDYPATVATTWEISLQSLENESLAGAALLYLCAFFAPDDIPRSVIAAGAEDLSEPLRATVEDALAFDDAVAAIRRYSLIETGDESALSLHRLVQAVIRDRLGEAERGHWAEAAVKIVNRTFPSNSDEVTAWKACARLLPHAQATANFAERLGIAPEAARRLFNKIGTYSWSRADYVTAKAACERALGIAMAAFGSEHPNVATALNNLATILRDVGDFPGARAAYERALRINETMFGPEHPMVATIISNLGSVLQVLGDFSAARAACERALRIDEAAFGPEDLRVAIRASTLGSVLQDLGDLSGAKAAFDRALSISEAVLGPEHPTIAVRINNLGSVLRALGNFAAAKALFERALRIDEAAFGPEHPNVAVVVNNLATTLRDLGDFLGAKAAYERAIRIDEAAFGPEHPNVAARVNNLSSVLYALNDLPGAKAALERALRIDEVIFGPKHPNVAIRVNNLGSVLFSMGDALGAKAALERALLIDEATFGPDHPEVATDLTNLSGVLRNLGDRRGAKSVVERALRIDEKTFGRHHPNVARDINVLGSVLQEMGDFPRAKAAYDRALTIYRQFLGDDHPDTQSVLENLRLLAGQH